MTLSATSSITCPHNILLPVILKVHCVLVRRCCRVLLSFLQRVQVGTSELQRVLADMCKGKGAQRQPKSVRISDLVSVLHHTLTHSRLICADICCFGCL